MSSTNTTPIAASSPPAPPDPAELRFDLMVAIRTNQEDLARRLISAGADLSQRFGGDSSPLCTAAVFGRPGICDALVRAGSDLHVRLNSGLQPLHLAVDVPQSEASARTCEVLIAHGAQTNATAGDLGRQPLHFAAARDHALACAALLVGGAELEEPDANDDSPLACAVKAGSIAAARTLLKAGANPNWWPDPEKGRSLVRHAEFTDDFPMLWTLLSYGADHASDLTANFTHMSPLEAAAYAIDVERFSELLSEMGLKAFDRIPALRTHAEESTDPEAQALIAVMDAATAKNVIQSVMDGARRKSQPC